MFRSQPAAVGYLQSLTDPPLVSAVTVAELYVGVRDGAERVALDRLIAYKKPSPGPRGSRQMGPPGSAQRS